MVKIAARSSAPVHLCMLATIFSHINAKWLHTFAGVRIQAAQLSKLVTSIFFWITVQRFSKGFRSGDWAASSCSGRLLSTPSGTQLCGVEQCPMLRVGEHQRQHVFFQHK